MARSQAFRNARRLFTTRKLSEYNNLADAIADAYGRTLEQIGIAHV